MDEPTTPRLTDNPDAARYEAHVGADLAGFAAYRWRGERIVFTHTEVDPAFEGQGIGSALARFALDDVRSRGLIAVPLCPFISAYLRRHPEYADIVEHDPLA
jgi:predicted GNAT family acetyltransferase